MAHIRRLEVLKKKPVGHRKPIHNDSQKEMICDWVDEDCTLTLEDLDYGFESDGDQDLKSNCR